MLIIIISKSSLKLGQVGLKIRLLGQIVENPCVHSRGHCFSPQFRAMKLGSCIHLEEVRSTMRSILSLDLLFTVH